ncbi:MAG TPA: DUF3105 domain-containing protein [Gaiellaceae bacterium]|nr:DUF3105 domain-containing protein [Gaiellaceae bacterium]
MLLGILGASAVVLVIAAVAFLTLGGSSSANDSGVADAMKAAGCTFKTVEAKPVKAGQIHVPDGTPVKYNTFPPSAGSHYATPAIWDFYTTPVEPRLLVHNQEHGGVILWWGPDVPKETVDKIHAFYNSSPVSMVGSPIKGLGKKVAITAWTGDPAKYGSEPNYYGFGHVAVCPTFNESAFKKFRDAYRGHGPEGISMGTNQPGT